MLDLVKWVQFEQCGDADIQISHYVKGSRMEYDSETFHVEKIDLLSLETPIHYYSKRK